MDKFERIFAAVDLEEVDRVPISLWQHHPQADHVAEKLAKATIRYYKKYDIDMVKVCPFGLHCVADWGARIKFFKDPYKTPELIEPLIKEPEDYLELHPLSPEEGYLLEMVKAISLISKELKEEVPILQTGFSPLMTCMYLSGDEVFEHLKTYPREVKEALKVIEKTTLDYLKASIDAGARGVFFATKAATYDFIDEKRFDEFGRRYDLKLLKSLKCDLKLLHIHGENIMFDFLLKYPVNLLNWHSRGTPPSLSEARRKTKKCLVGGLDEKKTLLKGTGEEIREEILDAIEQVNRGLIIGPGCVIPPEAPEANLLRARVAVDLDTKL
ncbi:MAG: uroporphyrinogen decarboxylase family protein [Candidatus Methanofastidiosia archaeon]